jgi:hypothetical protein
MSLIVYPEGKGPANSHWFYNNTVELRFDKPSWSYHRVMPDGSLKKMAGVTGTCHIIDKSEVLMRWAVKKSMEKLKRLLTERGHLGETGTPLFEEVLDDLITSAKKADKEELEAAGETGHIAHDWIEQYVKAVLADSEDKRSELLAHLPLDDRAANACIAGCEWMDRHNVRWIATERKAFSMLYEYAGTMDGLARVDSCDNPACCPHAFQDRLTLVDWKTSNYLYIEYLLQTAAYQQAYQEETGIAIEDRWVIRLGKDDAEFDPWHMEGPALFEEDLLAFLNALALTRSVEALNERIDGVMSVKKAAQKAADKAFKDAANLLACPVSDEYKGKRLKKGCNDTESMCVACTLKYQEEHDEHKT